jgi:hypothetical protein
MYSTLIFVGDKIVEHVVAIDYGSFLQQVSPIVHVILHIVLLTTMCYRLGCYNHAQINPCAWQCIPTQFIGATPVKKVPLALVIASHIVP